MRKVLISVAAAASALAIAAPASAQWMPAPPPPYGNAYGYQNNYGQVRSLQVRVDAIQRQIQMLDRRNMLSGREARRLRDQSRDIERQLYRAARNGLNPYEARNLELRIARLEQRVRYEARDGRWGRNDGRFYGDRDHRDHDRDRDGRRDRDDDD